MKNLEFIVAYVIVGIGLGILCDSLGMSTKSFIGLFLMAGGLMFAFDRGVTKIILMLNQKQNSNPGS